MWVENPFFANPLYDYVCGICNILVIKQCSGTQHNASTLMSCTATMHEIECYKDYIMC